jgi:hypothetical protein
MGRKVLNRKIKRDIKEYARRRFGRRSYWPYLALYTEIRGEFIEGWIPYDYYRFTLVPKLNPEPAALFDSKIYDYRLFGDFAVKPLFLYISGKYYDADLVFLSPDQVMSQLSEYDGEIVIKEEGGWGGLQVRILPASEFSLDLMQNEKNYVIQPYVRQHKILSDLYPHSVNTFRVNTFLKKDGSAVVKYLWLRFGGDGGNVDNITSGGDFLYFYLDGTPEEVNYEDGIGTVIGDRHKNTGYRFADLKIPMFHEMLEACRIAHQKFPYIRLIAWDVCIDHMGKPKLIEWNTNNPDFFEKEALFGPFWTDDEEI